MDDKADVRTSIGGRMWTISAKLFGVGELIKFQNGEPALDQSKANLGVGEILTDLAGEIEVIRDEFEARDYQPTRAKPRQWDGGSDDHQNSGQEEGNEGPSSERRTDS